jgi:hypothetical protein
VGVRVLRAVDTTRRTVLSASTVPPAVAAKKFVRNGSDFEVRKMAKICA